MRAVVSLVCVLAAMAIPLSACGGAATAAHPALVSARGYPLADMSFQRGGHTLLTLTVEVADNQAAWDHGLMDVKSMPADRGMAFVFPQVVDAGFWMKNTLIPLDIAFWDTQGHVVDMLQMTPCKADPCYAYYPSAHYIASVETNWGVLEKAGVKAGDVVRLTRRAPASPAASASPAPSSSASPR
jgi:uncharacterized protein